MQGAEERRLRRMSNTPQGGTTEGNAIDGALMVYQGGCLCLDIDPKVIADIVLRILDGNYSVTLHPIAGAAEGLAKIQRHYSPVIFITARPYPGPIQNWLSQTLGLDPASFEIIATGSHEAKAGILQQRKISYFVEDRLETCFLLQDTEVQPVLFRQPWNREQHPFVEVNSWDELQALIDF